MKDMATTRMLLTTALLAAVAALLTTPAQAFWMDVEGGGGSGERKDVRRCSSRLKVTLRQGKPGGL